MDQRPRSAVHRDLCRLKLLFDTNAIPVGRYKSTITAGRIEQAITVIMYYPLH